MDDINQTSIHPEIPNPHQELPVSSYGKRNWKKWIPIYLLIAAIVYGAVYFLFLLKQGFHPYSASYQAPKATSQPTQIQDETANWKTYTNKDFSFELKYPNNWYLNELREGDFHLYFNPLIEGMPTLTPNQTGGPIALVIIARYPNYDLCKTRNLQCTDVAIAGLAAKRYELQAYSDVIVFEKDNYIFEFLNSNFETNKPEAKSALGSSTYQKTIFDQILSTFKFTDQTALTGMELVKIEQGGGLCPNGPCSSSSTLLKDGSVIRDGKKVKTINKGEIIQIQTLINNANFAQIKSKPFTGTCPTAYDGQEITYVFYTNSGAETISSCKVKIDINDPLFKKTYDLLK